MSSEVRKVTCIICPVGCEITVTIKDGKVVSVEGAGCPRGRNYAIEEVSNPRRVVISVVKCVEGDLPVVSVKTSKPIPKSKIWDVMKVLANIEVRAPVKVGDVIIKDVLGLGVDIVATRSCRKVGYS